MEVKRGGSQPSRKGPEEYFTGSVRIDPLFQTPEPARTSCALVTFEPGAESAWHWHPYGATSTTAISHIAIQEALDGKVIERMEKVSDEQ
jgi:quercetin dioxygenase-like cupin family protein